MKAVLAHVADGQLTLEEPIASHVHGRALVLLPEPEEQDRLAWLKASEERLMEVWDNEQDDVYNELLTA